MKKEVATLAGGCFWGMEELFRALPGVLDTEVGYSGGQTPDATYNAVRTGRTGHAESLQISFDADKLSFEDLLLFFFKVHDPTTADQQGNDIGSQYRSAIFYHSPEQHATADKVIARVNKSEAWKKPIVTQVTPFSAFYNAEDYHQDYLQKTPDGYTCHFVRRIDF